MGAVQYEYRHGYRYDRPALISLGCCTCAAVPAASIESFFHRIFESSFQHSFQHRQLTWQAAYSIGSLHGRQLTAQAAYSTAYSISQYRSQCKNNLESGVHIIDAKTPVVPSYMEIAI